MKQPEFTKNPAEISKVKQNLPRIHHKICHRKLPKM